MNNEDQQKLQNIFKLQTSITHSKEIQDERFLSYEELNNKNSKKKECINISYNDNENRQKKLLQIKKQRDKKKLMSDWIQNQEKMAEKKNKEINEQKEKYGENSDEDNVENEENNNERIDMSKYNVVNLDEVMGVGENKDEEKNNSKGKEKNNEGNEIEEKKEIICVICQRKFPSVKKLEIHEKLSEMHKRNLEKLKLKESN